MDIEVMANRENGGEDVVYSVSYGTNRQCTPFNWNSIVYLLIGDGDVLPVFHTIHLVEL
jgi:hypothetical protein